MEVGEETPFGRICGGSSIKSEGAKVMTDEKQHGRNTF